MKNTKYTTIFMFLTMSLFLFDCQNSNKEKTGTANEISKPNEQELSEGFQLLENNCFSCHSPDASLENRIAPPMVAIKKHYITSTTTRKQFTKDLLSFVNNPSEEKSKMPGAIKRFDVMPKMNFSEAQITKIASYIYFSELEKPNWFEQHYKGEKKKYGGTANLTPMEAGRKIAMKTKKVLGKNLLQAINDKGTANALTFCAINAIPLTDSMAVALYAQIKRVSDKNRNPANKANEDELDYIRVAKLSIDQGKNPQPHFTSSSDKQLGYYPIMTNNMCMQCHGQPNTEVLPETLSRIKNLYPNDKAIGYKVNELRGIWVIEMDK